jgi:hypothetical protein
MASLTTKVELLDLQVSYLRRTCLRSYDLAIIVSFAVKGWTSLHARLLSSVLPSFPAVPIFSMQYEIYVIPGTIVANVGKSHLRRCGSPFLTYQKSIKICILITYRRAVAKTRLYIERARHDFTTRVVRETTIASWSTVHCCKLPKRRAHEYKHSLKSWR